MDEIELLVAETYKHFHEHQGLAQVEEQVEELLNDIHIASEEESFLFPEEPGIIYHVQKTSTVFVIRTFVSRNIRDDYFKIIETPEDYPSLRLVEAGEDIHTRLKFFIVENPSQAEIIHDQLHNRRFPVHEELMCNLSDPGFSWWLTKKAKGFQLAFTMSVVNDNDQTIKLGPLGDRELALRNFQTLGSLISSAGIEMNIQNEMNRVQFTDCEEFILEELKDVFEFGVLTQTFQDLFKILARKIKDHSTLEQTWFYLQELAAMRRFWIQIQFDLNAELES